MAITTGKIIKYTLLPGILPRLGDLFASGFAHVAYLIAQIYGNLGLLPLTHPYLNPRNFGLFNIRNVIAAAGRNLEYSLKKIDQVIIFYTVITGLVLLALQIGVLIFYVLGSVAIAAPSSQAGSAISMWTEWFGSFYIAPDNDISFVVLDKVFGMDGIFNSCISKGGTCVDYHGEPLSNSTVSYPYPIHTALHGFLSFYSYGIFFVATIIILYFVVTLIGETAATGKPFGSRMNHTWTVPRLILFFALLMPLSINDKNVGINGAQFITMYAAKYGSNFATNTWGKFNSVLTGSYLGETKSMIARPNFPDAGNLLQFMYTARTCQIAEEAAYDDSENGKPHKIDAYIVRGGLFSGSKSQDEYLQNASDALSNANKGDPAVAKEIADLQNEITSLDDETKDAAKMLELTTRINGLKNKLRAQDTGKKSDGTPYTQGSAEHNAWVERNNLIDENTGNLFTATNVWNQPPAGALRLVYTQYDDAQKFSQYETVKLAFGVYDQKKFADKTGFVNPVCGAIDIEVSNSSSEAALFIQTSYYVLLQALWMGSDIASSAVCFVHEKTHWRLDRLIKTQENNEFFEDADNLKCDGAVITEELVKYYSDMIYHTTTGNMEIAIDTQIENGEWEVPEALLNKGWAGAGLWYNRIAEMNGAISTSVFNFPRPKEYPYVMEFIADERERFDISLNPETRFDPYLGTGMKPDYRRVSDKEIATVLNQAYSYWNTSEISSTAKKKITKNAFIDTVNLIFGTSGILDMRNNTDIHPLAQLSAIGRGLIEATARNTLIAFAGTVGGGIGSVLHPFFGQLGDNISGLMKSLIMTTLALGFTLYYIIPMMPFIYFFFAFGSWIKTIFEAMVAMPLWALSHIHIDGDGLPGKNASNGYFMIFEIFLLPVLILFGLVASISIFAAMVSVLNSIFDLVISSAGGFNSEVFQDTGSFDLTKIESFRGPIDQFFFTVMYVIICYMIGLACFKMVDLVPKQILRWMGFGTQTFSDIGGNSAEKLTSTAYSGTQKMGFTLQRLTGDNRMNLASTMY